MAQANLKATITAEDKASSVISNIGLSFGKMASAIGIGSIAANALHTAMGRLDAVVKSSIGSASGFEQYRVSFETMLGSADAAKTMLQALSDFAAKTPFTLPGIVDASKNLLAMGVSANELLPDIKMLGDIAAGVGTAKLPEISLAFAQVAAKGKLAGQEIIQFSNAGVPVIDEVAKSLGKTRAETIKLSESGQISFGQVRQALVAMTGPGGRFFDLMDKQSKTFGGTVSNISDQMGRLSRQILGISEDGTIQAGGPFAHLKAGAEIFMNFITTHSRQISIFFEGIFYLGEMAFKAIVIGAKAVGSVLSSIFPTLASKMKATITNTVDMSGLFKNTVPTSTKAAGEAVDKLGQQLGDLNDQIQKSSRDYREQLAQMVKSSQEKVKSLQGQLNEETNNFKDAQDQQASDHADKVKTIEDQINKEVNLGILGDHTKLANLQQELAKENIAYDKQAAKQKADHDKKMADLQAQLNQETDLLQRHADDIKNIQDVTLLDTIDSLKRSHTEQLAEYEKQRKRIVQNAGDTGSDAALAQLNAFAGFSDQFKSVGDNLGLAFGQGMKNAWSRALKAMGHDALNWGEALAQTVVDLSLFRQLSRHKSAQQLFEDNLTYFQRTNAGRAVGGNVQAGQIYPVGEQGMEYFSPDVNGKIIPNNKIGSMDGGSPPVNITIQAGAFMGSQQDARQYAMLIMGAYSDAMRARGMA